MQKTYLEHSKEIPVYGYYDVVVAGSGPAGFGSAYAAAKAGAKTLIVEQGNCIGGIATAGLMSHWVGKADSKLYREILQREKNDNAEFYSKPENLKFIDNERLKGVMLEMLLEVGAEILFYTFASDAIKEGDRAKGIIIQNKSGRSVVFADVIIDATGDGDIACKLGAEYNVGREADGKMQPATLMFKVAGVDTNRAIYIGCFEDTYQTEKGDLQTLAKKYLEAPAGHVLLMENPVPGIVTVNMTNAINVNGTDAKSITDAELLCRKQMSAIEKFLREFVPGYENCYIISSASLIGVRETRHFVGKYTITKEDILEARQFEDWAVRGAYFNFDVHGITGSGLDVTGVQKKFDQKNTYTIPYGCLVPKTIKGLLLAGRCISGTHMAHSNYRAMPICLAMGEVAGTAAALASKRGITPDELPIADLQACLED